MNIEVLICFYGLLTLSFCQESETEVNQYVTGIETLQRDALSYNFSKNSDSYAQGVNEYADCVNAGTYDIIIVGAGSSGTVLANRLSEIPELKILILEAGTWENYLTDIPGETDFLRGTPYNWGFIVTPQRNKFGGYLNRSIEIPRGKALGGSSVINAMIYARGNKVDFDKWGAMGNPGWFYKDVLPYFMKSENASFSGSDDGFHGHDGTLHVENSRIFDEVGQAFLDAQVELNRTIGDYNGDDQMTFSILQMNEINGRRDSGGKAFLNPARDRSNLNISPESLVLKIIIDETNTARGVKFIRNNTLYFAKASKEVIVSAGALQTPQLLMLSGIGPRDHLEKMGIRVKKDLPVGDNLWDHLIYNSQAYSINHTYENSNLSTQVRQYLEGEGPLTSPDSVQCVGYVSVLTGTETVPDTEHVLHTGNPSRAPYQQYKQFHRYTEETVKYVSRPQENKSQWSVHSVLLHAKSRGTVRLNSDSPFDFPLVDPRYLTHGDDIDTMVLALRDVEKIARTSAMQKYNSTMIRVVHPLCEDYPYGSNDFWRCMVINLAETVHHFGGTCKMGPESNPTTVVDHFLRVHGTKHLRVADCSVIPSTLSGHTNAPAYMIGEKAADIIKEQHMFPCNPCETNYCDAN